MRFGIAYGVLAAAALLTGGFLLYASRTTEVVLFSHGTPEVPSGRMFVVFNPFRDRTSEHTAERLIDDLRGDKCEQIVRGLEGSDNNYDPRVCSVMRETAAHSLVWRQDGESARVLVYAVPEKSARLWVTLRRDEAGFMVSRVSVVR
jgi:hypothetical protein